MEKQINLRFAKLFKDLNICNFKKNEIKKINLNKNPQLLQVNKKEFN